MFVKWKEKNVTIRIDTARDVLFFHLELVEIERVEHIAEYLSFLNGNGNTLAHLLVVGRPGTKIINRLALVPADKVKLLVPAVIALAYDTDLINDYILDFRHLAFSLYKFM